MAKFSGDEIGQYSVSTEVKSVDIADEVLAGSGFYKESEFAGLGYVQLDEDVLFGEGYVLLDEGTLFEHGYIPIPDVVDPDPTPIPVHDPFEVIGDVVVDTKGLNPNDIPDLTRLARERGSTVIFPVGVGKLRMVPKAVDGNIWIDDDGLINLSVTKQQHDDTRTRHTELEFHDGRWEKGRFWEFDTWYKQVLDMQLVNWEEDDRWEVLCQYHGKADPGERARNPLGAFYQTGSDYQWQVRADSKPMTENKNYTRYQKFDMLPGGFPIDGNIIIESYIKFHWSKGSQIMIVNGQKIIDEAGIGNCYNDQLGPVSSFGIYKYFDSNTAKKRHIKINRAQVQQLQGAPVV